MRNGPPLPVVWRPAARDDRHRILTFLAQHNPAAALRVVEELTVAADSLATFPHRGRPGFRGTRELVIVRPYVLVYRVRSDAVVILRIWHGAQDRP